MQKVMITGGAGFIGSNVAEMLAPQYELTIVDNLSSGKRANLVPEARFFNVDVTTPEFVATVAEIRPDIIVHLAAQISVARSVVNPLFDLQNNIAGTLNVLEAARKYPVQKVIYASSAAVYGNPQFLPISEDHPVLPLSPYGISKHSAEHYLRFYFENFGVKYTILRFANVYGPKQDAAGEGGVVSIFVRDLNEKNEAQIFGDGEQTRDFIFVKDIAAVILTVFKNGDNEIFNVGSGIRTSVNELFRHIASAMGKESHALYLPPRPGDIQDSVFDCLKLTKALSWKPRYDLSAGLGETIAWFTLQRIKE